MDLPLQQWGVLHGNNDSKSAFAICLFEFILDAINFPLFAGGVDNAVRYKHTSMYVCTHIHIYLVSMRLAQDRPTNEQF